MVVRVCTVLHDGFGLLNAFGVLESLILSHLSSRSISFHVLGFGPEQRDVCIRFTGSGDTVNFEVDGTVQQAIEEGQRYDVLFLPHGEGFEDSIHTHRRRDGDAEALALEEALGDLVMSSSHVIATGQASRWIHNQKNGLLDGATFLGHDVTVLPSAPSPYVWTCSDHNGNVTAELDLSLRMVAAIFSPGHAKWATLNMEYERVNGRYFEGNDVVVPSGSSGEAPLSGHPPLRIGFVVYDKFEMMDTFGPMHVFRSAEELGARFHIDIIAEEEYTRSFRGPRLRATIILGKSRERKGDTLYDLLFLPGGIGTLRECNNKPMIQHVKSLVSQSRRVMTVCTGSGILASAGVLDGMKATTNKISISLIKGYGPKVEWQDGARWVEDGKFFTSSGVSAGTDLALRMTEILFDSKEIPLQIAHKMKYVWNADPNNDPFARNDISLVETVLTTPFRWLLDTVFWAGFSLSFPMKKVLDI